MRKGQRTDTNGHERIKQFLSVTCPLARCDRNYKLVDGRTTNGRTTEGRRLDGYTISSPCEPNGSGELKKGQLLKKSYHFLSNFHQIFYSSFYISFKNIGFKPLAVILVEILHLQNCNVNFKIFKGQN